LYMFANYSHWFLFILLAFTPSWTIVTMMWISITQSHSELFHACCPFQIPSLNIS
jgi:hypothetical protein